MLRPLAPSHDVPNSVYRHIEVRSLEKWDQMSPTSTIGRCEPLSPDSFDSCKKTAISKRFSPPDTSPRIENIADQKTLEFGGIDARRKPIRQPEEVSKQFRGIVSAIYAFISPEKANVLRSRRNAINLNPFWGKRARKRPFVSLAFVAVCNERCLVSYAHTLKYSLLAPEARGYFGPLVITGFLPKDTLFHFLCKNQIFFARAFASRDIHTPILGTHIFRETKFKRTFDGLHMATTTANVLPGVGASVHVLPQGEKREKAFLRVFSQTTFPHISPSREVWVGGYPQWVGANRKLCPSVHLHH